MSGYKALVFFVLCVTLGACTALTIPAFFWSGRDYLTSKYAHIGTQQQLLSVANTQMSKQPKLFVAFLHKNLPSSEFLKHSGAFSAQQSNNAFANLEQQVKTEAKTSIVFPNCESHPSTSFTDAIRDEKNVKIVSDEHANGIKLEQFVNDLSNWKVNSDNEVYIVQFGDANNKDQYANYDDMMNKIVAQANKITNGDYIAMFSSELPKASRRSILSLDDDAEEVQDYDALFGDNTLAVKDANQATPTPAPSHAPSPYGPVPGYPNGTYANPSYITGSIFGGTLVAFLLFFLLAVILYGLLNIQTAPHMTDVDFDGSVQKKNQ